MLAAFSQLEASDSPGSPGMALACHEQVQEPKTPLGLHDEARTVLSSPHSEVLEGALLGVDVATRKGGERRSAA